MAETTLYQLASQGPQQMMSYILRTKSGKLAVIDGGNHLDTDYLLEFLHSISQGKPVVEAWFLTHAHSDHVDAFLDIQREHAGEVDIRHVYYRFPDEGFIAAYEPGDVHTIREWNDLLPRFERLCVPVEEGQRIQVEELLFEVLYIPDPAFTTNAINNSSIVLRLTVDGQRVLFLSDLGVEAGEKLLASYGPEGVRATICQMAHHGQAGVAKTLYAAISPKICLWCTPQWLWDNDAGQGYNTHTWQTVIVRGWMEELGAQRHIDAKDGTQSLTLPAVF